MSLMQVQYGPQPETLCGVDRAEAQVEEDHHTRHKKGVWVASTSQYYRKRGPKLVANPIWPIRPGFILYGHCPEKSLSWPLPSASFSTFSASRLNSCKNLSGTSQPGCCGSTSAELFMVHSSKGRLSFCLSCLGTRTIKRASGRGRE